MQTVYVAAPSRRWAEAAKVMDFLEARGVKVALRWDRTAKEAYVNRHRPDPDLLREACLSGLRQAQGIVVVYNPKWTSVGMWAEVGFALASNLPMLVFHDVPASTPTVVPVDHCWLGGKHAIHTDRRTGMNGIYSWARKLN